MTYNEKLRNPQWQKKRLEIMQRDKFTCIECESDKLTLHVHHRYYISGRQPWEYPGWALVTLCEKCHTMMQERHQTEFSYFEHLIELLSAGTPDGLDNFYFDLDYLSCELQDANPGILVRELMHNYVAWTKQRNEAKQEAATESIES